MGGTSNPASGRCQQLPGCLPSSQKTLEQSPKSLRALSAVCKSQCLPPKANNCSRIRCFVSTQPHEVERYFSLPTSCGKKHPEEIYTKSREKRTEPEVNPTSETTLLLSFCWCLNALLEHWCHRGEIWKTRGRQWPSSWGAQRLH